ncbi:putative uncharacterized protein DDB_G0271606 isoform X2 [Sycon ciliatum]|uniref:putative uncharacterized protein DDB_G0271606 isoform X2 n=1 Tax=Sycon ciliatum TaxID=27933 RepID=UPI0031F6C1F8
MALHTALCRVRQPLMVQQQHTTTIAAATAPSLGGAWIARSCMPGVLCGRRLLMTGESSSDHPLGAEQPECQRLLDAIENGPGSGTFRSSADVLEQLKKRDQSEANRDRHGPDDRLAKLLVHMSGDGSGGARFRTLEEVLDERRVQGLLSRHQERSEELLQRQQQRENKERNTVRKWASLSPPATPPSRATATAWTFYKPPPSCTADSHQSPKVHKLNPPPSSHAHKIVHRTGASSGSSPSNRTETGDGTSSRFPEEEPQQQQKRSEELLQRQQQQQRENRDLKQQQQGTKGKLAKVVKLDPRPPSPSRPTTAKHGDKPATQIMTWGGRDQPRVTSSPVHTAQHSSSHPATSTGGDKRDTAWMWLFPSSSPPAMLPSRATKHDQKTRTADSHQYPKVHKLNSPQTSHAHTTKHDHETRTADSHQYPEVHQLNPPQTSHAHTTKHDHETRTADSHPTPSSHAHKGVHRTGASSGSSPSNRTETGDGTSSRFPEEESQQQQKRSEELLRRQQQQQQQQRSFELMERTTTEQHVQKERLEQQQVEEQQQQVEQQQQQDQQVEQQQQQDQQVEQEKQVEQQQAEQQQQQVEQQQQQQQQQQQDQQVAQQVEQQQAEQQQQQQQQDQQVAQQAEQQQQQQQQQDQQVAQQAEQQQQQAGLQQQQQQQHDQEMKKAPSVMASINNMFDKLNSLWKK